MPKGFAFFRMNLKDLSTLETLNKRISGFYGNKGRMIYGLSPVMKGYITSLNKQIPRAVARTTRQVTGRLAKARATRFVRTQSGWEVIIGVPAGVKKYAITQEYGAESKKNKLYAIPLRSAWGQARRPQSARQGVKRGTTFLREIELSSGGKGYMVLQRPKKKGSISHSNVGTRPKGTRLETGNEIKRDRGRQARPVGVFLLVPHWKVPGDSDTSALYSKRERRGWLSEAAFQTRPGFLRSFNALLRKKNKEIVQP